MRSRATLLTFLPIVLLFSLAFGTRLVERIDSLRTAQQADGRSEKQFELMMTAPMHTRKGHQLRTVGTHTLTILHVKPNHDATADIVLSDGSTARLMPEDASEAVAGQRLTIRVAPSHVLSHGREGVPPTLWLLSPDR